MYKVFNRKYKLYRTGFLNNYLKKPDIDKGVLKVFNDFNSNEAFVWCCTKALPALSALQMQMKLDFKNRIFECV
ncbi:MAG TPA: hypothetical protein DDY13_19240 [Cytophagales bacterium]|nr:hypothetical protein [Cytophagales bacterium]